MSDNTIYCIDFDGTVAAHEFPEVGPDVPYAVEVMKKMVERGDQLILWTMRSDESLQAAIDWFKERDIPLWGIQSNPEQRTWTDSPKAYCHVYIDDHGLGCPMVYPGDRRGYVDWVKVAEMIGIEL